MMWRYVLNKRVERAQRWVVWRLPRWMVMWATIRLWAHGTTGRYGNTVVGELRIEEALRRWDA